MQDYANVNAIMRHNANLSFGMQHADYTIGNQEGIKLFQHRPCDATADCNEC